MDISTEKYKSNINRWGYFSAVLHTLLGIVKWLIGVFTLTEEERLEAGVMVGNQWRDK